MPDRAYFFSMLGGPWQEKSHFTYADLGMTIGRMGENHPTVRTAFIQRALQHDKLHGLEIGTTATVILDQILGDVPQELVERMAIIDIEDDGALQIRFANGGRLKLPPGPIAEMRYKLMALL